MTTRRERIQTVASAQKLLLCMVVTAVTLYIVAILLSMRFSNLPVSREFEILWASGCMIVTAGLVVVQIYCVIRLSLALGESWGTVLYALFQLVPCLNLVLLLFLNGRATRLLQQNGVRVGLMGAVRADLDRLNETGDWTCSGCGELIDADTVQCPVCGLQRAASVSVDTGQRGTFSG